MSHHQYESRARGWSDHGADNSRYVPDAGIAVVRRHAGDGHRPILVNVHLATWPAFTLPGDISATDRATMPLDIAEPPFVPIGDDSTMSVPDGFRHRRHSAKIASPTTDCRITRLSLPEAAAILQTMSPFSARASVSLNWELVS